MFSMSFQPRSRHQNLNSQQFREYMKHCQEALDSIDPDTGEPADWKVWGVFTFQGFVTPSRARQLFYRWLGGIRKEVKLGFVNWFVVIVLDCGKRETRVHFLLGGSHASYQARWTARWQHLSGGDAAISEYRPDSPDAFVRHVLKNVHADQYFQITINICGYGPFEVEAA
jgi:hypothetical protein